MLTESQVHRSFRMLLDNTDANPDIFEKAELLLENLRPESPLRHRLTEELDELRNVAAVDK